MAHTKLTSREKRKDRIRKKVSGSPERPRLTVFKSNRYIYAQIIDDVAQKTLLSASSLKEGKGANKKSAALVGESIATKALQSSQKIEKVIFDRNGYRYHGVIKEIADAARKAGLQF